MKRNTAAEKSLMHKWQKNGSTNLGKRTSASDPWDLVGKKSQISNLFSQTTGWQVNKTSKIVCENYFNNNKKINIGKLRNQKKIKILVSILKRYSRLNSLIEKN
jgi:hypothetical protein